MTKRGYLRRLWVARALLLALAVVVANLPVKARVGHAQAIPQPSGNAVLVSPNSIEDGTPLDCVYEHVQQGLSIDLALAACDLGEKVAPEDPNDISSGFGLGGGFSSGTTVGSASCSNGTNPQISKLPGYDPSQSYPAVYSLTDQKYNDLLDAVYDARQNYIDAADKEAAQNFVEAVQELNAYIEDQESGWWESWWDGLFGDSDESGTNQEGGGASVGGSSNATDPNADNACHQVAVFVAQCNANGWTSPECKDALNKMQNCDPTITDPRPGEDPCAGEAQFDPEEVERVAALVCSMYVNPADPNQDPCAPVEVDAEVVHGVAALDEGNFMPVCGDLRALTGEDQCVSGGTHPSVIYAQFRGKDIEEIMRLGQEKLGGPGWIIPMLGPGSPDPGRPQPETGEPVPNLP